MMLQIKKLSVSLIKDNRKIIENFDFVLRNGDKAVIIGEEGNGKSTLLKLIKDSALVDGYCEYTGDVIKNGLRLGYLPQEYSNKQHDVSIAEYLGYDKTPGEIASAALSITLPPDFVNENRTAASLSGGERVKLELLRLILDEPEVLLLDEPTNDIDLPALSFMENFIKRSAKPILFVSHDETLIERTANVIIHIEQLRRKTTPKVTVARMTYGEYIANRERAIAHQTQLARAEKSAYDAKTERYRQIYQKVGHRQDTISRADPAGGRLLKKKMHSLKAQGKRLEREASEMTQTPDVEEQIFMSLGGGVIPNGKTVLDFNLPELRAGGMVLARDIQLRVTGSEKICITGLNGTGKTTLIRLIAEELLPRKDITAGYMPQNYKDILPNDATPVEFLAPSGRKDDITRARTALGSVKYTAEEMMHAVEELSGGQKAKLILLKMSLEGCNVLILDEPTRNLSPLSNPVVRSMLCGFGGAVIAVSHDRKFISEVAERVLTLDRNGLSGSAGSF